MRKYINVPYKYASDFARAEVRARALIESNPNRKPWLLFKPTDEERAEHHVWWIDTFGVSEEENEEHAEAIAARYHRTPFWKRKQRQELMRRYITCKAVDTVAAGLTTEWR